MRTKILIITLITFILFFIEALIHFNIGANGTDSGNSPSHKYWNISSNLKIHIPTTSEFIKIFFTVLLFSSMSGIAAGYIIVRHT